LEPYVIKLAELGMNDVERVGGKNASLGEMISNLNELGVTVPGGFATTATAYRDFLAADGLDARINSLLDDLDVDDIEALTSVGRQIRGWILDTPLPERLMKDIRNAWEEMSGGDDIAVAVRSSATAEDLPDASFAGQQETFLNVRGVDHLNDAASIISMMPCTRCSRRCSTTGPLRIACTRDSITGRSRCRWACRRWFEAKSARRA
jgi:pyruvate,water dikinase